MYKINANTPFRIAIWDYDHSFGRDGDNELNMLTSILGCQRSNLLRRLMSTNAFDYNDRLAARWRELRSSNKISSLSFNARIDELYDFLRPELPRNFEAFPYNGKFYYDANDLDQEVGLMREYIELRIPQLDKRFGKDLITEVD